MKSDLLALLAKSPLLALPLVALFLFIVVFVGMFIVTMRQRAQSYEPLARLPLEDEDLNEREDAQEGAPL